MSYTEKELALCRLNKKINKLFADRRRALALLGPPKRIPKQRHMMCQVAEEKNDL